MTWLLNILINFPPEIATGLLAMLPVGELRAAIPVGVEVFGLKALHVFIIALIGNSIPAFGIIFGLEALTRWCDRNFEWGHRLLTRVFARTERVFHGKYERYGAAALFIFTAVPLPFTGVWTASIAAVLFRIEYKYAIPAILGGMVIAGIIVISLTLGAGGLIRSLFLAV